MDNSGNQTGAQRPNSSQSGPVDELIARIAARQERLITVQQLYAVGLSRYQIRRRVERALLHVLHGGVLIVGPRNIAPKGHLKGALLTLGDTAFLSHRTSLAFQGLCAINVRQINVTVVAGHTPRRPGLIIHRASTGPHRHEIRERFGIRYSSLARALIEVAPQERPEELMRLVTAGLRKNLVDLKAIKDALERHHRRPGVGILASALGRYIDRTDRKSGLELSFDAYCATDPRIPPYRKNVHQGPYEWDVVFAAQRLIVELDGRPYHVALQDMENDRAKDIWAQRHGLRIMRITDFAWDYGRLQAVEDLLALLALGGWRPPAA